jgi:hypothetical protein
MGLFDLFSNDTAEQAAQQRNAGLTQGYSDLSGQYDNARGAINTGANTATGYYQPLMASTGAGAKAYGNASGANGAAGLADATANFKNSGQYGAYGVSLNEGLQALDRTHAAAGNLNSGNADTDAMKYAADQASKAYGGYVAGLQPYLGANANAVGGAAGVATGQGAALASTDVLQGNAANTTQTGIGASNAAATMNNYNVGKNQLGAILGVGQLAMGMPPTSFSGIGGAPTVGGTSLGGPNGPAPTTGGLFSMFG